MTIAQTGYESLLGSSNSYTDATEMFKCDSKQVFGEGLNTQASPPCENWDQAVVNRLLTNSFTEVMTIKKPKHFNNLENMIKFGLDLV